MERKIGEEFFHGNSKFVVVENDSDDIAYFKRGITACSKRCGFLIRGVCHGVLSVTGDCQKKYRKDKRHVYFEDAALARSPLGAAAANSAKIVGKS